MLNLFVLASGSQRNAVNAKLKEGRGEGGGVRALWARCDNICGLREVFQQIMTAVIAFVLFSLHKKNLYHVLEREN